MKNDTVNHFDTEYAKAILIALQYRNIYLGTVDDVTIAKRRAKNKIARAQRNINRKNGRGI